MIEEITISDTEFLITEFNKLPNSFIYRGHSDSSWKLESTLERIIGNKWSKDVASKYEEHYLNIFKSKYHIYNESEHEPKSKLSWLSVMQHYGAPTRLIDFTVSPYIALYFALEDYNPQDEIDLAVYAIDYSSIMDASLKFISTKDSSFQKTNAGISGKQDKVFDDVVDRFSYEVVWITEPLQMNARIDRQAGTFLISGDKDIRVEDLLLSDIYKDCSVTKYCISHEIYENLYALLRKMNINSKSLYGDLSGLAKSIKMDMRVYAM